MPKNDNNLALCFFLQSGKTFTFKHCQIVTDNETMLVFSYTAMSDGKPKQGFFLKTNLAGWAVS